MKATEKTWVDRSANELKEKEKARAMRKDYHPKAGTRCILNPSSLLITCLGSCGPRCPVSSNLDLNTFPFRGWPESSIVFRFRESSTWKGGNEQEVTRNNKQSYSHLWGTLPKSLGACENVNKKHILLILLLVDCGNGPTDFKSWKETNRTWKGHGKDMWHERKGSGCTCYEMKW